ncbi:MAG: CRISPR-associated helicase Cas3' [Helicobacteraceae bacterium]|jgi:CRISPR-associated endonuclease/helicase Cas3|nr:CRISPR-associated helicase Cas3' [Helicobacteraceae bacterium]
MRYVVRTTKDGREQDAREHFIKVADKAEAFAKKFGAPKFAFTAGALHDLGKLSAEFAQYMNEGGKRGSVVHSTQGARYVLEQATKFEIDPLIAELLALCIAAHHGELVDAISPSGETPLLDRMTKDDPKLHFGETVSAFERLNLIRLHAALNECADEMAAFAKRCRENRLNCNFALHLFAKSLFSCLVDADRLDAYTFETGKEPSFIVPSWENLLKTLETYLLSDEFAVDTPINQIRQEVSARCIAAARMPRGIFRLDAPTGGGKTYASLSFALIHAMEHKLDRIIIVIPYLSILDQTASKIREALGIGKEDDLILEHHSNLLPPDEEEKATSYRLATERWEHPIIITTMTRFMETIYSSKSGDLRRFHNMARSAIIFDEVQSLPIKCISLFNEAVNYLYTFAGSSIMLCTATQPPLNECQHPIRATPTNVIGNVLSPPKRVEIQKRIIDGGHSMEQLRDFVSEELDSSLNCLVILNTKKDAIKLYKTLKPIAEEKEIKIIYLSTLLYPKHRLKLLGDISKALEEKKRLLVISTQLIEAGVDISFECVVRALAGLDSIAQAAGRCNRHGEYSHICSTFIINVAGENLTNLPDIAIAAKITERVLYETAGDDPLSPRVMRQYYRYYFYDRKNLMDYDVDGNGALYDWLSSNAQGKGAFKNAKGSEPPRLTQAFRSAAEAFSVIDQNAKGIIVCHDEEAQALLNKYENAEPSEKSRWLRQLQRYSISLYKYEFAKIAYLIYEIDGLSVLPKGYYDSELGVYLENIEPFKGG